MSQHQLAAGGTTETLSAAMAISNDADEHPGKILAALYERRTRLATIARMTADLSAGAAAHPLSELRKEAFATDSQIQEIERSIASLTVAAGDAPTKAAALLMIREGNRPAPGQPFGDLVALETLRPFCIGLVRLHADYVLANSELPIGAMPFWSPKRR